MIYEAIELNTRLYNDCNKIHEFIEANINTEGISDKIFEITGNRVIKKVTLLGIYSLIKYLRIKKII